MTRIRSSVLSEPIVGYVSDREGVDEERSYYRTQHALAPVLVERGAWHAVVVGDFRGLPPDVGAIAPGTSVILDLGDGTLLLSGSAAR